MVAQDGFFTLFFFFFIIFLPVFYMSIIGWDCLWVIKYSSLKQYLTLLKTSNSICELVKVSASQILLEAKSSVKLKTIKVVLAKDDEVSMLHECFWPFWMVFIPVYCSYKKFSFNFSDNTWFFLFFDGKIVFFFFWLKYNRHCEYFYFFR